MRSRSTLSHRSSGLLSFESHQHLYKNQLIVRSYSSSILTESRFMYIRQSALATDIGRSSIAYFCFHHKYTINFFL